jgi:hypothetical protein
MRTRFRFLKKLFFILLCEQKITTLVLTVKAVKIVYMQVFTIYSYSGMGYCCLTRSMIRSCSLEEVYNFNASKEG